MCRLLFLFIFRDFDKGDIDAGLEFTTLSPTCDGKILCRAVTLNLKGLRKDRFIVDASTRKVADMSGRYICYWISETSDSQLIYNRVYQRRRDRTYVHVSRTARSTITFDARGFEKRAENLVSAPRRYHEKFVRLLRF